MLVHRLVLGLLAVCMLMAGCAGAPFSTESKLQELGGQVPLSNGYNVTRAGHFPLASNVEVYVQGDNTVAVQQLKSALKSHFALVSDYPDSTSEVGAGFLLNIELIQPHAASTETFDQPALAADASGSPPQSDLNSDASEHSVAAVKSGKSRSWISRALSPSVVKYKISVSDVHGDAPFDDVMIILKHRDSEGQLRHDSMLLRNALDAAAAQLSGHS